MARVTIARDDGGSSTAHLTDLPKKCPWCHHGVRAEPRWACEAPFSLALPSPYTGLPLDVAHIQVVFVCPLCGFLFFHLFRGTEADNFQPVGISVPGRAVEKSFSPAIVSLSQRFVAIFNEATCAEGYRLKDIAGCGYRKALEILIKDFLISQNPLREADIKDWELGKCIREFVPEGNLKECARRAAWLGNDAVHYLRKWEDKDIDDLKTLLELTVLWIESDLTTKKYVAEMRPGK